MTGIHCSDNRPDPPVTYDVRPIGWVRCDQQWPFDAPRQPGLLDNRATIEILPLYSQALTGLEEFSRIWIVFVFHNATEKLVIRPPRLASGSVGAFASRSPHRPNRLGISSVRLAFLAEQGVLGFLGFLRHQLSFLPDDTERKRVEKAGDREWVISYRTWRCRYTVDFENRICSVTDVFSGWNAAELGEGSEDPWEDKALHREYCRRFTSSTGDTKE